MVLFIKHIDIEGPGTIADFLEDNKIEYTVIDLSSGDKVPKLQKDIQTIICLGGPMNVYEENKYPFLRDEDVLLNKVVLNDNGLKDDLFKGLPEIFKVYQWHGDTFGIPDGGGRLAFSERCQNQVLKYGRNIYGIQFHVEVTRDMISQWADAYKAELESLKGIVSDKKKMLEDYVTLSKEYIKQAEIFYVNFFSIAGLLKRRFFSFPH